jgi:hypothetical protein
VGTFTGLDAFAKAINPYGDRPKAKWLKLENGQTVKIRFVSEVDPDSRYYDEERGLFLLATEHQHPDNFQVKIMCTRDTEGRCWACEQNARNPKSGWGIKRNAYFNVIVNDGKQDPYMAVWRMGVGPRSVNAKVIQQFATEEGGISCVDWRVTRNGSDKNTTYVMMPSGSPSEEFDMHGLDPFDLEAVALRKVPYAEQEDYFLGGTGPSFGSSERVAAANPSTTSGHGSDIW